MTTKTHPELSPIARQVYKHLIRVLRKGTQSITYGALAEAVEMHRRSSKLHDALTEVTIECRRRELPAVTAMVWKSGTNRPSDGYYEIAHPRARSWASQLDAWKAEHAKVVAEAANLPGVL